MGVRWGLSTSQGSVDFEFIFNLFSYVKDILILIMLFFCFRCSFLAKQAQLQTTNLTNHPPQKPQDVALLRALIAPSVQHADTGWWQLKYFLCSSRKLGKSSNLTNIFNPENWRNGIQFEEHFFLDGWLNHQLGHLATHGKAKLAGTWLVSFGTCRMCLLKT